MKQYFLDFYDEIQLISETEKLIECVKQIEGNFFDVYKEAKDVKDLFFVPYKDASPITMRNTNFLYKRLVFCKMFNHPIKDEYIEEGREFFIKNRPDSPNQLKDFEDFCNNIKASVL